MSDARLAVLLACHHPLSFPLSCFALEHPPQFGRFALHGCYELVCRLKLKKFVVSAHEYGDAVTDDADLGLDW
jgi:hypothetical protein